MDLEQLKALAEDVKGWSNCNTAWLDHSEDESASVVGHIDEDGEKYCVTTVDCNQYYKAQDSLKLAKFYAAANPATVLELIEERNALRRDVDELRTAFSVMKAAMPEPEVDDDVFVQPVPDHCDRITWRNTYYHLPLKVGAGDTAVQGDMLLPANA